MRRVYFAAGLLFVALGTAGAFLPLLPTVPFLLLAVFCFARSNREWERRILEHPTWGPQIHDWRDRGAINRRAKVMAVATLLGSVAVTWFAFGHPWVWITAGVAAISGTWISTRPE